MRPSETGRARAPRFETVRIVHQRVPGRLRVNVAGLKRAARLKMELENRLLRLQYVLRVDASAVTGNILIIFDRNEDPRGLIITIEDIARAAGITQAAPGKEYKRYAGRSEERASSDVEPQPEHRWHAMPVPEVIAALDTSPRGLSPLSGRRTAGALWAEPFE